MITMKWAYRPRVNLGGLRPEPQKSGFALLVATMFVVAVLGAAVLAVLK
jgi:hypothetical protein